MFLADTNQPTATVGSDNSPSFRFPSKFSFLPNMSPCFTLNRNSTLVQLFQGERNGLHMLLFFNESDYKSADYPVSALQDERKGLMVSIHDPKEHSMDIDGISLPPGFHTHIAITKHVYYRKKKPFQSKCFDGSIESYPKIVPGKYRVGNCYFSCYHLALYNLCQVVIPSLTAFMPPDKYPSRNLSAEDLNRCHSQLNGVFRTCDCRIPCYEEMYKTKVVREPWPQSWQATQLLASLTNASEMYQSSTAMTMIKKHLIKLSVYYEELIENVSEEKELYQQASILSDMGGQMGLFLGASLLSVIEVCWLICRAIQRRWRERKMTIASNSDLKLERLQ